ncbi:hypothetical protein ATL17_1609 [Maritalea mobilis]|uniref:Uncharacterized protein n=1 Tax=Maritalea mobilis TaxID=483324 RepID=A0A4R6VN37_9HYPH|nr:hypothetical protein [Maritalea mobilis]TDQ63602.1 hypothetical protein ATL17_1609 [Maritalea mobilis]
MAFEFTLEKGDFAESASSNEDNVIILKIGHDIARNVEYSLNCSLSIAIGENQSTLEFVFMIIETKPDGTYVSHMMSGLETKGLLTEPEQRTEVLDAVRFSLQILAENLQPSVINMMTCETNLPRKALMKYDYVFDVLPHLGYDARRGNQQLGTHIWIAKRIDQPANV